MTGSIGWLAAACGAFVGSHLLLSGPAWRDRVAGAVGERAFVVLYSLISLAMMAWVVLAYRAAPDLTWWAAGFGLRAFALFVMLPAAVLLVCGVTTRNPSAIGQSSALEHGGGPRGILTVTRHPVMWAIVLWALAHTAANGDAASLILFASLGVLALAGIASQESKKRARLGEAWRRFAERTSVVPFAAVLGGRTTLDLAGIGWARVAGGVALYAVLLGGHPAVIGVAVFPP